MLILHYSMGCRLKALRTEIQPIATRATALSLAQSANCVRLIISFTHLFPSPPLANHHLQLTNFFIAFITPILLSRTSSGIYFLFGAATILTVAVTTLYVPETKGRDLEAIGESFGLHRAADMPVVRALTHLGSWVRGRMVGISREGGMRHVRQGGIEELEVRC